MSNHSTERSWRRTGCFVAAVVLGSILVVAAVTVAVAYYQLRSETRKAHSSIQEIPETSTHAEREAEEILRTGHLALDISIAQLTVVPAEAGESIRVDAEYDPRFYHLSQTAEDFSDEALQETSGTGWSYRIRFAPLASAAMALLRVKLGGEPPKLRIALPRDVSLTLTGEVYGSFAALELGELHVDTVDLEVSGGAVAVSFAKPLQTPMERLSLRGDKGSVKVVGLGGASPRVTELQQHLGELDLDLRGPWSRDADIRLSAYLAGGSVWLPGDVSIEGLDGRLSTRLDPDSEEIPRPRLRLSVIERGGRLVFVD